MRTGTQPSDAAAIPDLVPDQTTRKPDVAIHEHVLLRRIGRGAYGEVWLARNALGAYRAVKVVYRKDFEDSRPFEREFRGIQKFEPISRSHEGLVNILQVGLHEDYFYYVMELADEARRNPKSECRNPNETRMPNVERPQSSSVVRNSDFGIPSDFGLRNSDLYLPLTLREELRVHGRLSAERCIEIGLALCSALEHLHKNGLVHRDIKPSNIILVGGKPKLADIGLVTEVGDSRSIVGTEGYLPPEGPGTPQADIFSLGKVLYEISTGQDRRKFPDLPPDLKEWPDRENVLELNEVVVRACAQDNQRRYSNCADLVTDLEILHSGGSVKRERALSRLRITARKAALVFCLALVVLGAVLLMWKRATETYPLSANPEVNVLVNQGNHCVFENLSEEGISNAVAFFTKAAKLDPTYLPAHFGLYATCFRRAIIRGQCNPPDLRAAAARLDQLARGSTEALTASSMVKWFDWDFRGALADARLATQKRGGSKEADCGARLFYGFFLLENGSPAQQALREFRIAERLNSINPFVYQHLGNVYAVMREYDEALKYYQHCLEVEPRHYFALLRKASVYEDTTNFTAAILEFEQYDKARGRYDPAAQGFYNELREAARSGGAKGYWSKRLEIESKSSSPDLYYLAVIYAHLGDEANAYVWLRKACKARSFNGGLLTEPCWDHSDKQFIEIAKRYGFLQGCGDPPPR